MSESLSLIIFDIDDLSVAVSAESVNFFVPIKHYDGQVPPDGFPYFIQSSGIVDEDYFERNEQVESFVMIVANPDGTNTCYLTPPPRELVEYHMSELYPLPLLIEKVSSVSNLSGYCLHRGILIPVLEARLECKDYREPMVGNSTQGDHHNV